MTLRRTEDWLAEYEAARMRTSERKAQSGLLQYEAGRQARRGLQDDPIEAAFQLDGLQQARLVLMQHGKDPRLLQPFDNGSPYERERQRRQNMGCDTDFPDLILFASGMPTAKNRAPHGLFIENKRPKKDPRQGQAEIMAMLEREGFCCVVCHSAQEIVEAVLRYLGIINSPPGGRSGPGG